MYYVWYLVLIAKNPRLYKVITYLIVFIFGYSVLLIFIFGRFAYDEFKRNWPPL